MNWFHILGVGAALLSLVFGMRTMRAMRAPVGHADVLLSWDERPLRDFTVDPFPAVFIRLNSVATLALAAVVVFTIEPFERVDFDLLFGGFAVAAVAMQAGQVLSYLVGDRTFVPATRTFTRRGFALGPHVLPWRNFSHYTAEPSARIIRLYSAAVPEIAVVGSQMPDLQTYERALDVLEKHLPNVPPNGTLPWYRSRWAYLLFSLLTTVPFLVFAVVLYTVSVPRPWLAGGFAMLVMTWLALRMYDFLRVVPAPVAQDAQSER